MPWTTRLARRLLGWLMPADLRDFFLDDLDEAFSIRVASQGRWRGAFWYWRQAITGLPFILRIRIRVGLTNHTPEVSGMTAIDTLVQDVRHAVHILATSPGFTLAAATTLALGIGANTAIFSVIRTVILQPPPYGAPDRVVMIWNDAERSAITHLSVREVVSYRESTRSLEHVAAYTEAGANLTGGQEPERVRAAYVTAGLFDALGVPALLGRTFLDAEDAPGADAVVVLGHGLWQRRFGAVTDIVGRTIPVNGSPRTVVGVMPPSFRLPLDYRAGRPTELFVPLGIDPANLGAWGDRSYIGVGLLRAGTAPAAATSEFKIISDGWIRAGFVADQGDGRLARSAIPVQELITGEVRRPLLILLGAVGFILLIACANLVNLLLARADLRRREVAVRAALGAVRGRIVRQLLTESLLLSIVGGVLGLAIAYAGTAALTAIGWAGVPRLEEAGIGADALAFAAALTVVSGIVSGLAPAFSLSRPDLSRVLQDGGRSGTPGRTRLAIRRALVVFQLACSVVLVIGAGLLVRSLVELYRVDLGFDPRNVLTAQLLLPPSDYPESADVVRFYRRITERAAQLPGVTAAGAVRVLPLSRMIGNWSITLEGRPHSREENPNADFQWVTPGYFEAMG
ncbi:MAG TPA: ABC transporter permease, partial [Vicinamibacterales bacterium]|nr:ABC transporter permease [Vicinamibacterales bacterium]